MIPNMSKLSKNWLIPEIFPSSQKFRENSRWDWILKFRVLNQVPWWKLSWKNTQYMEISQNQPILEHFGISGFRESQNPNCAKGHQKSAKILQICYSNHLCKNISKKHLFWYCSFLGTRAKAGASSSLILLGRGATGECSAFYVIKRLWVH